MNEGEKFEQRLCEVLKGCGFWVHRIERNASGQQPFDVIAIKDGHACCFECKVVSSTNKFPLSRVEDNQVLAGLALRRANSLDSFWFAFKRKDDTVWITPAHEVFDAITSGEKSIRAGTIRLKESESDDEDNNGKSDYSEESESSRAEILRNLSSR